MSKQKKKKTNQQKNHPKKASKNAAKHPTRKPDSPKPRRIWLEWLISLLITMVILGIIIAAQSWYTHITHLGMKPSIIWPMHIIGGIIMLFIVHHFVKPPKDDNNRS